jgi:serine/threonine protein kinase
MSSSCNSWRLHITRLGNEYSVKRETLESRLQLFVPETQVTHISIGKGAEDYIHIKGLSLQHVVCILSEQKMTLLCRDAVHISNKKVDVHKGAGEQFVLDMQDMGNHNFRFTFPNGTMIDGRYRREQEVLPKETKTYLENTYGSLEKIEEGPTTLIYKTKNGKALKILRPSYTNNKDVVKRFLRAAEHFKAIEAPFFIKIHDIQHIPEKFLAYVVMDYFAGETLENFSARKAILSSDEARDIVCAVSRGLAILQDYGYSCRNLSPENLLVDKDGEVRLTGFFLLKSLESNLTLPGARMVISNYSAPEQVSNPSGVDVMADMFSLGAIFYKLVVGEPPLSALNSKEYEQKLAQAFTITPEQIHDTAMYVPPQICHAVSVLLSADKTLRPTPRALLEMLGVDKKRIPPVQTKPSVLAAQEIEEIDIAGEATVRMRPQPAMLDEAVEVRQAVPVAERVSTPQAMSYRAQAPARRSQQTKIPAMALLLVALVLAAGAYWYFSVRQTASIGFGKFLPATTKMVLVCDSFEGLLRKLNLQAYPRLHENLVQLSQATTGGNLLDANFYKEMGIAVDAPLGVAVTGSSLQDLHFVLFTTLGNANKLIEVMQNPTKLPLPPLVKDRIGGVNCMLDQKASPSIILCCQGQYALFYTALNKQNLVSCFQQDILGRGKRFYELEEFQTTMQNLAARRDGYVYMNMPGVESLFHEAIWKKDMLASAVAYEIAANGIQVSSYLHLKKDSELINLYQTGSGKAIPFMQRISGDPLLCSCVNSDIVQSWQMLKNELDKILQSMPNAPAKSMQELMQQLQKQLAATFDINIVIEKEVILNCLGQFLLVVYNLPQSLEQPSCDVLFAASLRDASITSKLLNTLFSRLPTQMPPDACSRWQIGNVSAYTVDLSVLQMQIALAPTVGIVEDCLVFTSNKELFTRVVRNEIPRGSELFGAKSLAAGSVKIGHLWQEVRRLMDKSEVSRYLDLITPVMQNLQEFKWDSHCRQQGVYASYHLLSEQNAVALLLAEIEKLQLQIAELRHKWQAVAMRPQTTIEDKLSKLEAAQSFQERYMHALLIPDVRSLVSRLQKEIAREADVCYQKITMSYQLHKLPEAWQACKHFPQELQRTNDMLGESYQDKLVKMKERIVQNAQEVLVQESQSLQTASQRMAMPSDLPSQAWTSDEAALEEFLRDVPSLQERYQQNQNLLQQLKQKVDANKTEVEQKQGNVAEFNNRYRQQFLQGYRDAMQARKFAEATRLLQEMANITTSSPHMKKLLDSYLATLRREHDGLRELFALAEKEAQKMTNRRSTFYTYTNEKFTGKVLKVGEGTIFLKTVKDEDIMLKISELGMQNMESLSKNRRSDLVELALGVLYFYAGEEKRGLLLLQKYGKEAMVATAWEVYK